MKKAAPVLKAIWFFTAILLVMIARAIPLPLLIMLTALVVAAALLREFVFVDRLDERQRHISHFSSHVAYFTYATLVVFVIINESFSRGLTATLIFWLLLFLPLLFKIFIVLLQHYGSLPMRVADYVRLFFRGIVPSTVADERQLMIGNFSSHIAFYVFLVLTIADMLWLYIRKDQNPPNLWYLLLIVPPMAKLYTSLLMSYGAARGAQFISATIVGLFFTFILLSHGLSLESLIEAVPFIVILGVIGLAPRQPRLAGAFLILLAAGLLIFFHGWFRMDIYGLMLMLSLIPIPVLLSGIALIIWQPQNA